MTNVTTKTRKVRKIQTKTVMKRAWEIARNAEVAHNTNPINVAQKGLVKAAEFFKDSLSIAWKEAKDKALSKVTGAEFTPYQLHKVIKKNQAKVLNAIEIHVAVKAQQGEALDNHELAMEIFNVRFGTPVAKSMNRHVKKALAGIAETKEIPQELMVEQSFA